MPLHVLPAGTINAGENPRDAALREFNEETGYSAKPLFVKYVTSYHQPGVDFFVYGTMVGRFTPKVNVELVEFLWLTYPEIVNLRNKLPGFVSMLDDEVSGLAFRLFMEKS